MRCKSDMYCLMLREGYTESELRLKSKSKLKAKVEVEVGSVEVAVGVVIKSVQVVIKSVQTNEKGRRGLYSLLNAISLLLGTMIQSTVWFGGLDIHRRWENLRKSVQA